MFQQPATERVVNLDPGHSTGESLDQRFVVQETDHQLPQVLVAEIPQQLVDPGHLPFGRLAAILLEIGHLDRCSADRVDPRQNRLQRSLIKLHLAFDPDKVPRVEPRHRILGDIPHQTVDLAGAVLEMYQQEKISVAVGSQLLLRQQKYLVDRLAVAEMFDELAGHEVPRIQRNGDRP